MYSSDSLQYLLTKWFEAVTTKHTQYTELLTDHIEISTKKVLDIALELEKMQYIDKFKTTKKPGWS